MRCCAYTCMHACNMVSGLKKNSVSAGDKIGIEHKNHEMGAVGGGGQTIPVRRLFGSCTVLYKERKKERN